MLYLRNLIPCVSISNKMNVNGFSFHCDNFSPHTQHRPGRLTVQCSDVLHGTVQYSTVQCGSAICGRVSSVGEQCRHVGWGGQWTVDTTQLPHTPSTYSIQWPVMLPTTCSDAVTVILSRYIYISRYLAVTRENCSVTGRRSGGVWRWVAPLPVCWGLKISRGTIPRIIQTLTQSHNF